MRQIVFFDTFGEIKQIVVSHTASPEKYGSGQYIIVDQEDRVDPGVTWVSNGVITPRTARPEPWSTFNYLTAEWEDLRDTDAAYDEAVAIVRSFRDAVNKRRVQLIIDGTDVMITGYGIVALQGRPEDQASLQGLAFGAQLRLSIGDGLMLMDFVDRNNTTHQLTPEQIINLWQQGAAFVSAVYARSWQIKDMDPTTVDPNTWVLE